MPCKTAPERELVARRAAHIMHSRHDPQKITAPARAAFFEKFLHEADPTGQLPQPERERRAIHLRKAYYARLALKSVQSRRRRREAGGS